MIFLNSGVGGSLGSWECSPWLPPHTAAMNAPLHARMVYSKPKSAKSLAGTQRYRFQPHEIYSCLRSTSRWPLAFEHEHFQRRMDGDALGVLIRSCHPQPIYGYFETQTGCATEEVGRVPRSAPLDCESVRYCNQASGQVQVLACFIRDT